MTSLSSSVNLDSKTKITTPSPRNSQKQNWSAPLKGTSPRNPTTSSNMTGSPPSFPDLEGKTPKGSPGEIIIKGSSFPVCLSTPETEPKQFLESMEFQLDLILDEKTVAPWSRQLIKELLSDCHYIQDAITSFTHEELQRECIRLTSNCRFVAQKLKVDEALEDRIKEYQVMRFHNYLLGMGNSIPDTQEVAELFITSLPVNGMRYDGGKWEYVYRHVEQETRELMEWENIDLDVPKPSTPVLDSIQQAATQCRNFTWEHFYGPLAEYVERCKPEIERKGCVIVPRGKSYVWTESIDQLVAASRWADIACILVRNLHDLPNIVPLALSKRIGTFQQELKKFQDLYFKSISEIWCKEEKRYVANNYELHDWVLKLEGVKEPRMIPKIENEVPERMRNCIVGNTLPQREELRVEYIEAQSRWKKRHDDVLKAEMEVEAAERKLGDVKRVLEGDLEKSKAKLKEKRLLLDECGNMLIGLATKVEALENSI